MATPPKGRADHWEPGTWNIACSMCGRKRKANEVVRNWQGLYRCREHNEERQPQDFVRAVPDSQGVPYAQPQSDIYIQIPCTLQTIAAVPGYALPGCCIPGKPLSL